MKKYPGPFVYLGNHLVVTQYERDSEETLPFRQQQQRNPLFALNGSGQRQSMSQELCTSKQRVDFRPPVRVPGLKDVL